MRPTVVSRLSRTRPCQRKCVTVRSRDSYIFAKDYVPSRARGRRKPTPKKKIFLTQRRKDAKRCRVSKSFLCAFAPLRENVFLNARLHKCSDYFVCKAYVLRRAAIRNQIFSSLRSSAYLSALCGEITVTAEDRRDTQRGAEKTFSEKNLRTCQALHKSERCGEGLSRKGAKTQSAAAFRRVFFAPSRLCVRMFS
jgi:hypothetical protein